MGEDHQHFNEDFLKKYGWVSCYECDKIFYDVDELIEHQENCDNWRERWPHN
jgi:hypothetical protein